MEHSIGNYTSDKVEDKQPRTIPGLKGLAKTPRDDFWDFLFDNNKFY